MYGVFKNFYREKCMHTANVRVGTGYVPCFLTIMIISAPKVGQTILPPLWGADPHQSIFFDFLFGRFKNSLYLCTVVCENYRPTHREKCAAIC